MGSRNNRACDMVVDVRQAPQRAGEREGMLNQVTERKPTPLPKVQLFVLLYLQLAEPITAHVMLPFIAQLIQETGITSGDVTRVGYYAGLIESLFFLTEAFMILQWGRLSDRIGRRPVLLGGLFGLVISMICFGLSRTFWAVVASRALAGALNGNTGVIKCMMGEITDETNIAQAFAWMPVVWATSNTIAPLVGGSLQHPYERFGGIFHSTFWNIHPYFLPFLIAALYATSAFALAFFLLKETAPAAISRLGIGHYNGRRHDSLSTEVPVRDTSHTPTERTALRDAPKKKIPSLRTFLTPRVLITLLNYSLFAITDVCFVMLQPLFLSTPIANGGLGMSPSFIGACLASFGIAGGAVSVLCFASLNRRFGTRTMLAASATSYIGCFALFPVMNALARFNEGLGPFVWVAFAVQLVLATLNSTGYSCILIFLTSAAPARATLGATNGLAQTTTSIMRCLGPVGVTALFAFSIEHNVLGGRLVYFVLCALAACEVAMSTLFPARPWMREGD